MITVEKTHKPSEFITIYRSKLLYLIRLFKPLVAFFLVQENFHQGSVIKGLSGKGLSDLFCL